MGSELRLRLEPRPSDLEAVRDLVAAAGVFRADEVAVAVELVEERLRRGEASGYHFVLADDGGRLVGYACYGPIACTLHSYDLFWIAARPDRAGRGLGTRLLAEAESAMGAMGASRVFVETSSRPEYAPARAFYEARGYRREAELQHFYAPGDHKVVYVKEL